ncbi:MAG TPA: hypothetical protein VKY22_29410 [Bradyrhizobium sp.]|nr:hypothetical protein [Bradyrhizobium sp.]
MADFIEAMQTEAKLRFNRELTPAEAAEQFALHPMETRVAHLRNLDTPATMTLRETAKRHAYEKAIRGVHETLRKVGR